MVANGAKNTFLTAADIQVLTGKKRHSAQCAVLSEMGYVYERRLCDGFPIVSRAYFNKRMGYIDKPTRDISPIKGNRKALEALINGST